MRYHLWICARPERAAFRTVLRGIVCAALLTPTLLLAETKASVSMRPASEEPVALRAGPSAKPRKPPKPPVQHNTPQRRKWPDRRPLCNFHDLESCAEHAADILVCLHNLRREGRLEEWRTCFDTAPEEATKQKEREKKGATSGGCGHCEVGVWVVKGSVRKRLFRAVPHHRKSRPSMHTEVGGQDRTVVG